jgi:hypothetical protein
MGMRATKETEMTYKKAKASGGGTLYLDVPAYGNAFRFLTDTLELPVVRAADDPIKTRNWMTGDNKSTSGVHVYFEDAEGNEIAYWTAGMNTLHIFATPRIVGPGMGAKRTLIKKNYANGISG